MNSSNVEASCLLMRSFHFRDFFFFNDPAIWFYCINIQTCVLHFLEINAFIFILHNFYSICLVVIRLLQHFQRRWIQRLFLKLIFFLECMCIFSDSAQIHETIETINQLKTQREFMLSFARDPQGFINDWLQSQCRDLKVRPFVSRLACKGTVEPYRGRFLVAFTLVVLGPFGMSPLLNSSNGCCRPIFRMLSTRTPSLHSVIFFSRVGFVQHPPLRPHWSFGKVFKQKRHGRPQ